MLDTEMAAKARVLKAVKARGAARRARKSSKTGDLQARYRFRKFWDTQSPPAFFRTSDRQVIADPKQVDKHVVGA